MISHRNFLAQPYSLRLLAILAGAVVIFYAIPFGGAIHRIVNRPPSATFVLGVLTSAVPLLLVAVFFWRSSLTPLRIGFLLFFLTELVTAGLGNWLALSRIRNLWVAYPDALFSVLTVMYGLAAVQASRLEHRLFWGSIPAFGVLWGLNFFWRYDPLWTGQLVQAAYSILLLVASLWTLFRLAGSQDLSSLFLHQDWFWLLVGMVLYTGTAVAWIPALRAIPESEVHLQRLMTLTRLVVMILAYLIMAWGMSRLPRAKHSETRS